MPMTPDALDDQIPGTVIPVGVDRAATTSDTSRPSGPAGAGQTLFSLFFWLLAGDFLFSMMEIVEPRVLPLLLQKHGATNKEVAVIVTSLASAVNCVVNPVVSYASDRTRSRWGRRIPYLALATPFVAFFLMLIPFAPELTDFLLGIPMLDAWFHRLPIAPVILLFGVLVVAYQIFNMTVGSIYYYLLRDVVPLQHLGKMTSLFRVFAYAAAFVFNYWLFGTAEGHARALFGGIAACYAVGYLLMCWKVREGNYPPVVDTVREGRGLKKIVANYVQESFGPPLYRWVYATRVFAMSSASAGIFGVFFARDQLGLDLDTIGKFAAWPTLICLPLAYPFGTVLDRLGAVRTLAITVGLTMVTNLLAFALVRDKWSFLTFSIIVTAASLVFNIAQSVFLQTMFHPDRVGQLSSANALLVALAGVLLGPLCGTFFDWSGNYRYIYLWPVIFSAAAGFSLWRVAYHWRLHGGPDHYRPPLGSGSLAPGEIPPCRPSCGRRGA